MTLLRQDTFVRADALTLGAASDGLGSWSEDEGGWGIASDQAYVHSDATDNVATLACGSADAVVEGTVSILGEAPGAVGRLSSAGNYLLAQWYDPSGAFFLWKCESGSFTQLGTASGSFSAADVIGISLDGDQVSALKNGAVVVGPVTETFNQTAQNHGIYVRQIYDAFDHFEVNSLTTPTRKARRTLLGVGR